MSLEKVLKHITHIIWTDKAIPGYFATKVKDNTIYHLLNNHDEYPLLFAIISTISIKGSVDNKFDAESIQQILTYYNNYV